MRILIAEDDQVLADGLLRTLRASGAVVDHVASGTEADAALLTNNEFDLLILDLGLPKMHGLEVLKKLRGRGSALPVLILTAADSVEERVKGLDFGADDYMAKPFSLQELEARVRALTRRGMGGTSSAIKHGPLVYDQAGRVATIDGKMIELSARELGLLEVLLQRAGRLVSKEQLWSACASGAKKSATTPSRSTSTGCARRSKAAPSASPPCAAWATVWKRFQVDMKHPLSRFAPSPSPSGGGRTRWPGEASSTGALALAASVAHAVSCDCVLMNAHKNIATGA